MFTVVVCMANDKIISRNWYFHKIPISNKVEHYSLVSPDTKYIYFQTTRNIVESVKHQRKIPYSKFKRDNRGIRFIESPIWRMDIKTYQLMPDITTTYYYNRHQRKHLFND